MTPAQPGSRTGARDQSRRRDRPARPYPGRALPRPGADQLDLGEVGRPHGSRTQDAPVRHTGTTQAAVLGDDALLRLVAAGPVAAGRHRAGDPAGRPSARFRVRVAASPLDGAPSRARRSDAGADLRLAGHAGRLQRADRPAGERCSVPPTSSSSTARSATTSGGNCRITSIGVNSSNSACSQDNTTVWPQPCRPWRFR